MLLLVSFIKITRTKHSLNITCIMTHISRRKPSFVKISAARPFDKMANACADPGIFVRGVQVNLTKKALTTLFISFFFQSSAYFTEVKWLISKKTIIFQGS